MTPNTLADPENMLSYINRLPDDLELAWQLGNTLPLADLPKPKAIVICGMGGSAIGGELVGGFLREFADVPVYSHGECGLPAWAKGKCFVICSSHSGNTEETLDSFRPRAKGLLLADHQHRWSCAKGHLKQA